MQDNDAYGPPSGTSDTNELTDICTRVKDDIDRILSTSRGYAAGEGRSNLPGVKRVVVLIEIDGEGAVFNLDLISKGIIGGREAGLQLATGVRKLLPIQEGRQLWAYVFLSRHRLDEALSSSPNPLARSAVRTLSDFMVGFSQANQRFMIVDVGGEKGAAYAKITALIEAEIRLRQTEKIIFAGTEADGYKTFFRTLISFGHKDKLVLLKTNDEDEDRFAELDLPMFPIENLFALERLIIPEKLVVAPPSVSAGVVSYAQSPPGSPGEWITVNHQKRRGRGTSVSGPTSLPSSPIGKANKVLPTGTPRFGPGYNVMRRYPELCFAHYLSVSGCKCKYRHDYDLNSSERDILRAHSKRYEPCQARLKGNVCPDGIDCIFAHKCPYLPNCHHLKENKCWFRGEDMHTPDEKLPQEDDFEFDNLLNFPKETN